MEELLIKIQSVDTFFYYHSSNKLGVDQIFHCILFVTCIAAAMFLSSFFSGSMRAKSGVLLLSEADSS